MGWAALLKNVCPGVFGLDPRGLLFIYFFNDCIIVPMAFLPGKIRVAFPGETQLRQSRAAQPTVHVGCISVSIIHGSLT